MAQSAVAPRRSVGQLSDMRAQNYSWVTPRRLHRRHDAHLGRIGDAPGRGGPQRLRTARHRLAVRNTITTMGRSHHDSTRTRTRKLVTIRAATIAAAMVQSSPTMNSYQNRPKPTKNRTVTSYAAERSVIRRRRCNVWTRPYETRTYTARRPRIATSWPGHTTPAPSAAQKVPNDESSKPTTNLSGFSGTRLQG